jgi:hypothetical protein
MFNLPIIDLNISEKSPMIQLSSIIPQTLIAISNLMLQRHHHFCIRAVKQPFLLFLPMGDPQNQGFNLKMILFRTIWAMTKRTPPIRNSEESHRIIIIYPLVMTNIAMV